MIAFLQAQHTWLNVNTSSFCRRCCERLYASTLCHMSSKSKLDGIKLTA